MIGAGIGFVLFVYRLYQRLYGTPEAKVNRFVVMVRQPTKALAIKSGLFNLRSLAGMVAEERDSAIFSRNAGDIARWAKAVLDGGLELPAEILHHRHAWTSCTDGQTELRVREAAAAARRSRRGI